VARNGVTAASLGKVQSIWMDITPDLARRWIKNNFHNRRVREDVVKAYARDMLRDQWTATHQGIAFDDRDELIDGQHRLLAIILSGRTVRMMVTFGLPSAIDGREMTTMDCVDRGATRSVGDQLTIQHGLKRGSVIASLCMGVANLCCPQRTRRLSVGQTLEVYRAFEPAVDYAVLHRPRTIGLRTVGIHSAFAFALMTESKPGTGADFWESHTALSDLCAKIMTGEGIEPGSAARQLRDFVTSEEAKLFTRSLDRGLAELTLQALWLELNHVKVHKLELGQDGVLHFRSLQADRVRQVAAIFSLLEDKPVRPVKQPAEQEQPPRPTLDRIMAAVEQQFRISRVILAGKGTDPDVAWPRTAFVSLALSYGFPPCATGQFIHRTGEAVLSVHIPRKHMSAAQIKILGALKARLGN
jgi:hypothetical protein